MFANHSSSGGTSESCSNWARVRLFFLSGTRSILHFCLNMIIDFIVLEKGTFFKVHIARQIWFRDRMTTVFAYHRVADYDFWRAGYARAIAATPEVRSYRIWRGQDDPNYVITAENFDSREVAEGFGRRRKPKPQWKLMASTCPRSSWNTWKKQALDRV